VARPSTTPLGALDPEAQRDETDDLMRQRSAMPSSASIESPVGRSALERFVRFHDEVYADRATHWRALVPMHLPMLLGEGPFVHERRLRPFVALDGDRIVARVVAVVDDRFNRHWGDTLGHLVMFEARPNTREAVRALLDAACLWLAEQGMTAARAGFGVNDMPFLIDDDGTLPPSILRQNPSYYHTLLKDAGFQTEQGCVDYKIEVTAEREASWRNAVRRAERRGIKLVRLRDVPARRRVREFAALWHDAFSRHFGYTPQSEDEVAFSFSLGEPVGVYDFSLLAYRGGEVVGGLWVLPDTSAFAQVAPGRTLRPDERVNFLGIGVREEARGTGVNLAMASHAYLELARLGATWMSYTLVMDDNWPSRRTAEKLGAHVCASYVVYRRNFRSG
jgi:GNAT superfamily N-acetyltransferase